MWFKKHSAKKHEMKKEHFGKIVLAGMLVISGNDAMKQFDDMSIETNFFNYLTVLAYLLFITRKTLEKRYSFRDTEIIVDATIDGLFDYIDGIKKDEKEKANELFKEIYFSLNLYLDAVCDEIDSEQGLKELTSSFLNDCDADKDSHSHFFAHLLFSSFIIHQTGNIFNDDIVIV